MYEIAIAEDKVGRTCMKCLKEFDKPFFKFKINRDYKETKYFDTINSEIHLCSKCFKESDKEIWIEDIRFEEKLNNYIEDLPMAGQELFKNRLEKGWHLNMEPQDWIDYTEGRMSDLMLEEYGLLPYTKEEIL